MPACFRRNSPILARKSSFASPENAKMMLTSSRLVTYCFGKEWEIRALNIVLDDIMSGLVEQREKCVKRMSCREVHNMVDRFCKFKSKADELSVGKVTLEDTSDLNLGSKVDRARSFAAEDVSTTSRHIGPVSVVRVQRHR